MPANEPASEFIQKLIDNRGATLLSFAQVEWFLAKIIVEAKDRPEYKNLDLSFSQNVETRAEKVEALLQVEGPFTPYKIDLGKAMAAVLEHIELRNFAAHGLMVRLDDQDFSLNSRIHFRLFRMLKGGVLTEECRERTLKQYTDEQAALSSSARAFIVLVRKIWTDLGLKGLDEATKHV